MKNTAGDVLAAGAKSPQECQQQHNINRGTKIRDRSWLKKERSKIRIAKAIGASPSTVSREIRRNSKPDGEYVWKYAQAKCDSRKHGLKGNHRKPDELWWRTDSLIGDEGWSPRLIAGVLRLEGIHIVKQTIYNLVHTDTMGKLAAHMPHALKYTKRCKILCPTKTTNISNRASIHDCPKEADGTHLGDWKMDTIVDSYGHAIVTLAERSTNFVLMEKLSHGRKAMPLGKCRGKIAVPLSADTAYDCHRQRKRVCGASRNHETAKPKR